MYTFDLFNTELTTFQQKASVEVTIFAKQFATGLTRTVQKFSPEYGFPRTINIADSISTYNTIIHQPQPIV